MSALIATLIYLPVACSVLGNSEYDDNSFFFSNFIQIAEAGKLKPLEVDLKRLEDMSDAIVQDFAATRKREEEMRSTNGMNICY